MSDNSMDGRWCWQHIYIESEIHFEFDMRFNRSELVERRRQNFEDRLNENGLKGFEVIQITETIATVHNEYHDTFYFPQWQAWLKRKYKIVNDTIIYE